MVPIMKLGIYGLILFLLIIFFCIISSYIVYKKWEYDCLVLTNKKCILCYWEIIKNNMHEFSLNSISNIDIEYSCGFLKILKIGNLVIDLKNGQDVYFDSVFNAKRIKNLILEARV
jgi:hypothetical protein